MRGNKAMMAASSLVDRGGVSGRAGGQVAVQSPRIESLEGLRGLMALWVWLSHVTTMSTLPLDKHQGIGWVLANGDFAVGVFIILSGFVISLSLDGMRSQRLTRTGYGVFLVRRGFRLFPIYLIALYLSVLLLKPSMVALHQLPWDGPRTADRLQIFQHSLQYFWQQLTLHSLLLHGVVPDRVLPSSSFAFIGQAWSLTLEWQFYLVAPLLMVWLARRRLTHLTHALVLVATIVLGKVFGQPSFLGSYLFLFAVGYFCQRLLQARRDGVLSTRQVFVYMGVQALLLSVTGTSFFAYLIWCSVFAGVLLRLQGRPVPGLAALESRPLQWLGRISYSFYCLHMLVMYALVYLLVVTLQIQQRGVYMSLLIAASLPAALLLSHVANRYVEVPMQRYGKRIAQRVSVQHQARLRPRMAD